LLYSTKFIQKIIILSIFLSIGLVSLLIYVVLGNISLVVQPEILPIIPTFTQMYPALIKIAILAIILPAISYAALLLKHRNKNDV